MFRARQYVVFFLSILSFLALLIRLFYLQVISHEKFSEMASEQHNRVFMIEPDRGTIYDRYMEPLAINLDASSIYADPRRIEDKERTARALSEILAVDEGILLKRFQKDKAFVWVKRKVRAEKARKVKSMGLEGVHFMTESERHYPNDTMAAHVIGFAGIDNTGLEGLELFYDEKLKGLSGFGHLIRDAKARPVLDTAEASIPPLNGYNIVLTIDGVIQYIVEKEIEKMAESFNISSASAIVMDPSTGKILAMANYPSYNLNDFTETPADSKGNTAISKIFEPGSAFKIVTASAALNEGIFRLDDKFYCEDGSYRIGGRILHDYHPYAELSFKEVFSKSSNIGTVKIAYKLGKQTLYDYIRKFGFGEKTGVDLPGEVSGIARPPAVWSRSDMTTIPMGQGIAVTPIQLACAISVIANNGFLVRPYVVDHITTWEGEKFRQYKPLARRKVLDRKTCKKMKDILRDVVVNGTGRRAATDSYPACGKTGTAQMVDPEGGYFPDKYNATFIGFVPKDKPVISIAITAQDPHPAHFGGSVAAPAFKNIAEKALDYLETNIRGGL